jgi:hypothetical protein
MPSPYSNTPATQYSPNNVATQIPQWNSTVAPSIYHTQPSLGHIAYQTPQPHSQSLQTHVVAHQQSVSYNPSHYYFTYGQPPIMMLAQVPFVYGQQPVMMPVGLPGMQPTYPIDIMPIQMPYPQTRDMSDQVFAVILLYHNLS